MLPLFTSLLNVICSYDPVGYGLPYNYLLTTDSREPLVQTALQVLIVCLDRESQPNDDVSVPDLITGSNVYFTYKLGLV